MISVPLGVPSSPQRSIGASCVYRRVVMPNIPCCTIFLPVFANFPLTHNVVNAHCRHRASSFHTQDLVSWYSSPEAVESLGPSPFAQPWLAQECYVLNVVNGDVSLSTVSNHLWKLHRCRGEWSWWLDGGFQVASRVMVWVGEWDGWEVFLALGVDRFGLLALFEFSIFYALFECHSMIFFMFFLPS